MGAVTWRKTGVYVLLVLPILGLAGIALAAKRQDASQQTGDPVADAARKAREQKKNATQPKKVFTNDDGREGRRQGRRCQGSKGRRGGRRREGQQAPG